MKRIAILGCTGSIGVQALDVISRFPDRFAVVGLAAGRNVERLAEQARRFRPRCVSVAADDDARALARELSGVSEVLCGADGAKAVASLGEADFVLAGISGGSGLLSTAAAIEAGKPLGLANKESMVLAGELLMARAAAKGVPILPVDSEHSAIFQSLAGHNRREIRRIVLTASGGPLRRTRAEALSEVTPAEALRHPNWSMGDKITIDSATLMNKGLEVIEARWLFDVPASRIEILVHPESVVHSMVEYIDGQVVAQLGISDMRGPISYALAWPDRVPLELPRLDLAALGKLTFEAADARRFPSFQLAYRALEMGGTAPAALSGSDEAAVEAFLSGRCRFTDIPRICGAVLEAHSPSRLGSVEEAVAASAWGYREAQRRV